MVLGLFEDEEEAPNATSFIRYAEAQRQAKLLDEEREAAEDEDEVRSYSPGLINALTLRTRANNPHRDDPAQEPAYIRSTANFLFGDEMAVLGIKWDEDGMTWKAETAKDMWADHPIRSTIAVAGTALPLVGAIRKSAKVGYLATKLAPRVSVTTGAGVATEFAERGLFGKALGKAGILPEPVAMVAKHGDNWTAIADELLHIPDPDAALEGGKILKYFDDDFARKVMQEADPQKRLEMLGGKKRIQHILLGNDREERMRELAFIVESGQGTPLQAMKYRLNKAFANTYFQLRSNITKQYVQNMNEFWDNAKLDELFKHSLDEADHESYYKFLYGKLDAAEFAKLPLAKQQYFQRTVDRYRKHMQDTIESGFITQAESEFIGGVHVAALKKKTDLEDVFNVAKKQEQVFEESRKIRIYPKLSSPTLLERRKTVEEVLAAQARGELIDDPNTIHKISILKDEILHEGYKLVRDIALKASDTATSLTAIKPNVFDELPDVAKKAWISLDDLPGKGVSERLRRMVAKTLGKDPDGIGPLPYVHESVFRELFDEDSGMFIAGHNAANALSLLTMMHKPAKTVFNPGSHMQNLISNMLYDMPMAGINPFRPAVIQELQNANKLIWEIAKDVTTKKSDATSILASREALEAIAQKGGIQTELMSTLGTKIDLLDEIMDPRVQQMIEHQAFENAEGFAVIQSFYDKLEKAGSDSLLGSVTKGVAGAYVKAMKGFDRLAEKTIKAPLLSRASAAYLAEDMSPKLATYLQLRKRGISISEAVKEVGRRFPQYKTVGREIKGARRFMFPWITFPAEMARIMKNNMTDRPLASLMWMKAAAMTQATMSGLGLAPFNPEEVREAQDSAPFWANKPNTVITSAEGQGAVGGGFTGGVLGGTIGGLKAGPLGFAIGASAGALVGGGLGLYGADGEDSMRAWVLDFLPHSAVLPQTYDVDFSPGSNMVKEALKLSPVEPLTIMMPLMRLVMGEDEFGNEIMADGPFDYTTKAMVQTFGLLSPPWVQKYGFRVGTPDAGFLGMDRVSTMTLAGAAGALAGYKLGGALGAAGIGAAGMALGSQIDTSRFEEDIGIRENPRTGERGNPVFDVLFNTATGLGKSWKTTPGQKAFNDKIKEDSLKKFRASLRKKLVDKANNGDEEGFNQLMQDYFMTYVTQYDNPREAQAKFSESMSTLMPKLRRNPQFARFSLEELEARLREATAFAVKHRGEFSDKRVEDLRKEIMLRSMSQHKKGDAIGFDRDFDFKRSNPFENPNLLLRDNPYR